MKKYSKKSVLLFAALMALCAFAMPSMASASSWAPIGTEHTLDGNLGFSSDALGTQSDCAQVQFTGHVVNAAIVEITSGLFRNCTLTGATTGNCTVTATGTNFPWTATARTTSDIQIHGVDIDVFLETRLGGAAGSCPAEGVSIRITGTLSGGKWNGNGAGLRGINVLGATGLVSHSIFGNGQVVTPTGTVSDNTQNTLTVS